jgi:hypothetical protein
MNGHGPALGETNTDGIAHANGQPPRRTTEDSEFLMALARRYILDPRTSVGTILMEPIGYGLVEMIITLKMTENVQV